MRRSLIAFAFALCLAPVAQASSLTDRETAELLERAQLWQSRYRDDLAREALDRLFRIDPNHPEGLVQLARIQLRAGQDGEATRTYERLRAAHPSHPGVLQLATLLRLRGPDKEKYRQAQQLARAGHAEEALKAFRALLPDGIPDDDLALEYALVLAATQDGWEPARAMFAGLAGRHPGDPKYRLALATHLSNRKPVSAEALKSLRELSAVPSVAKPAREAWRRAILRLDPVEESLPALKEYVADNPDDTTARERLDSVTKAVDDRRKLLADPAYLAKRDGLAALEAGQLEAAQSRLQEAIERRPDDAETAGALGIVRLRQARHAEAHDLFVKAGQLDAAGRAKWEGLARTARYWDLMQQAGAARQSGQPDLAEARLVEARGLDPKEPNAAINLARLYAARERAADAERLYREALVLEPGNTNALAGLATLLLRAGRDAEAAAILDKVDPAQRREIVAAVEAARAARLKDEAERLKGQGREREAIAALEEAAAIDLADPWLRLDLARAYASRGEAARGQALFDEILRRRPEDPDTRFAMAIFLAGVEREPEALAVLEPVGEKARTASMANLQRRLWVAVQGKRADAFARLGRQAEARQVLASAQQAIGNDAALALEVAGACVQAGEPAAAKSLLERFAAPPANPSLDWRIGQARLLDRMQADAELRALLARIGTLGPTTPEQAREIAELDRWLSLREARALLASGRREEAHRMAGELARSPRVSDPGYAAAVAGILIELQDFSGARPLVERALDADPAHPEALAHAGRLALRDGKADDAVALEQRSRASRLSAGAGGGAAGLSRIVLPALPGGPLEIDAASPDAMAAAQGYPGEYRRLAELLDQQASWLSSALDWRYRSGTSGKSQISAQELPLEWRPVGSHGNRWFVRADVARVNAGALDLADPEASTFGSALLCQPPCNSGSLPQLEKGVAFGAGLERDGLRVDVGTSPVGFAVVNVVGGILYKGDLGPMSYSVDASRRPVTSSLLSHSGTTDPNTGRTWGGVVATGVRLGLSRDSGGEYGAWSSLGLHRLGGRNVQDNDRAQLMAGGYRRFINEDDRQFTVGVTGMLWRHGENAGEFTFGHGGYYSPGKYGSLALPITYGVRTARTSFAVRASVSVAWSESKRAPFFPTDPGLQAQAMALAPVNGIDPWYPGGDEGRSYGRALGAALEHQLLPGLFVGGRVELERSTNYTPNRFLLYVRLATDRPSARPVAFPPEPVLPSSQY
jgi:tetratricopeptide (TPR) repeat protein